MVPDLINDLRRQIEELEKEHDALLRQVEDLTVKRFNKMRSTETTIRYSLIRAAGKSEDGRYDVLRHEPGYTDEVLARGATFGSATAIVKALNAECGT
jgi:DNA repair exonuclease SbcCD ATPase subunit